MVPSALKARSWMATLMSKQADAAAGLPAFSSTPGTEQSPLGGRPRPASTAGSSTMKKPAGPATTLMRVLPSAWSWYQIGAAAWTIG